MTKTRGGRAPLRPTRRRGESPEHASGERGRKRRGAQPGNLNALKHGFYAKHFRADELAELAAATDPESMTPDVSPGTRLRGPTARVSPGAQLNGEIGLTRVAARRVLALARRGAGPPKRRSALLNAISLAAMRVANLLKAKKSLGGNGDNVTDALQQALADVALESGTGQ